MNEKGAEPAVPAVSTVTAATTSVVQKHGNDGTASRPTFNQMIDFCDQYETEIESIAGVAGVGVRPTTFGSDGVNDSAPREGQIVITLKVTERDAPETIKAETEAVKQRLPTALRAALSDACLLVLEPQPVVEPL